MEFFISATNAEKKKLFMLLEIEEGHKIQAQGVQERKKFFACSNYWKTTNLGNTVLHKVSNIEMFIAGQNWYWIICVSLTLYNIVFSRTFVG